MLRLTSFVLAAAVGAQGRFSEVWSREQELAAGIVHNNYVIGTTPAEYMSAQDLPDELNWCDKDGVNYCTTSRNQHIPQYCGSCWAHGTVSALGDRIKIARKAKGTDINLAVQHILNCGGVGSCYGGSVSGAYQWIHSLSKATGTGIAYETSNPYLACSSDSKEGLCSSGTWDCSAENVAKTCSTFTASGGSCVGLASYPNATVSAYGEISGADAMMKEIAARGPIACGIDAAPIEEYTGGIATDKGSGVDHVVSVVGWGNDAATNTKYWIVRNSWGQYWGEFGYIRVAFGALLLEDQCTWATVGSFTAPENANQVPCYEDGSNCQSPGPGPAPTPTPTPAPTPTPTPAPTPTPEPKCSLITALECGKAVAPCISECKSGIAACIECLGESFTTCCPCIEEVIPSLQCGSGPSPGPTPTPSPSPTPGGRTHYGAPPCESDEQNVQVQGISGSFCSPPCTSGSCPTDVPSGVTATPSCLLQDTSGNKYCALKCTPSVNGECGAGACQEVQAGIGICTYGAAEEFGRKLALAL